MTRSSHFQVIEARPKTKSNLKDLKELVPAANELKRKRPLGSQSGTWSSTKIRADAELFRGSFLRKNEVLACLGSIPNLKDPGPEENGGRQCRLTFQGLAGEGTLILIMSENSSDSSCLTFQGLAGGSP